MDRIGEIRARRIRNGDTVLCYGYSTSVLSIVSKALEQTKNLKAIVSEARPELEGRLMTKEFLKLGVPTIMIIASAVSPFTNSRSLLPLSPANLRVLLWPRIQS